MKESGRGGQEGISNEVFRARKDIHVLYRPQMRVSDELLEQYLHNSGKDLRVVKKDFRKFDAPLGRTPFSMRILNLVDDRLLERYTENARVRENISNSGRLPSASHPLVEVAWGMPVRLQYWAKFTQEHDEIVPSHGINVWGELDEEDIRHFGCSVGSVSDFGKMYSRIFMGTIDEDIQAYSEKISGVLDVVGEKV